jgi:AraC-like DNA-binding protein
MPFDKVPNTTSADGGVVTRSDRAMFDRLDEHVVRRFHRLTGLSAILATLDGNISTQSGPGSPQTHPNCADRAECKACTESWHEHRRVIGKRPEPHWHRCTMGLLCAVVPVLREGKCWAMCKVVCPSGTDEQAFLQQVELLHVLVQNFTGHHSGTPDPFPGEMPPIDVSSHTDQFDTDFDDPRQRARHPLVLRTMEYIDHNLTDPKLSVASIAGQLSVNPTYLAHLFSTQVGVRMSRYISGLRVTKAMRLLGETDWQIKRVAYESGHANPDWFSQVFRARTGLTPRQYRRQARQRSLAT